MIPAGWHRLTDYAISRGDWSVAKFVTAGKESFVLFSADKRHGVFPSAQLAADEAERIEKFRAGQAAALAKQSARPA